MSQLRGRCPKTDAERHLDYVRRLRIRLLGDRVLQAAAWKVADQLGWADTLDAVYVALTQLQADALITLKRAIATGARGIVRIAPLEKLA